MENVSRVVCVDDDEPAVAAFDDVDVLVPPARVGPDGLVDNKSPVSAVAVSACGNFAGVGVANGDVHRFNLQSGAHRGAFKRDDLKTADTVAQERLALAR